MKISKRLVLASLIILGIVVFVGEVAQAEEKQYTFYFVSHMGEADPNMKWLTVSSEDFMKRFPEVKIVYVAPEVFSVEKQIEMVKMAIAAQPDGLIVPLPDAVALESVLNPAIASGIPVVCANTPDFRTVEEGRIPYLTYVGEDFASTGYVVGKRLLESANNGEIPMPEEVVITTPQVGHRRLDARAQGMIDLMAEIGVNAEMLAIGDDQAIAQAILREYLNAHPDVNVIYSVAALSLPWDYAVAKELGREPDVDDKDMTIVTADASPACLEGILSGKVLASHSQGFYLQGWIPAEWLYFYNKFGYEPPPEILTGPVVIDSSNVAKFKETVMTVFGKETYNELILWPEK